MSISDSEQYNLLDQLAEEFAARLRRGERPSLKEYTDRYPELADEIRDLFPAMVKVEQAEDLRQRDAEAGNPRPANQSLDRILRETGTGGGGAYKTEPMPHGREIGDYRILREIGRGGMGVVYEAEQISLGRRVALKVLPRNVSGDRLIQERFRREARAAARLHHTNIVPVFEVGHDGDVRFYAMQFIQGQGLDTVITELRRIRNRARSESKIRPAFDDPPLRPREEHSRQGIEDRALGEGVDVSPVLRSILSGRFDPVLRSPEPAGVLQSTVANDRAEGLASTNPTGTKGAPGSDPALARTEPESAASADTNRARLAHSPALALSPSAPPSSSSAVLPGGTQLSSAQSGRRALYRSLAHIGRQVAGGLAYAHARGILHRDIKPSNLLLDTEGVVWIADFGLAKGEDEGLTQTGDIVGTIRYMAPERFRGQGDARADVYALGMTLYELLTLRPGFESADRLNLIEQIKTEEPQRPRAIDARIPRDLETIVLKSIDKDPKARYQSAEAMGEDVRRFLADEPIQARRASLVERYTRWARRNPSIAALGAVLIGMLVVVTAGALLAAQRFHTQAGIQRKLANEREVERLAAVDARADEASARGKADQANISLRATQEELNRTVYATRSNLALAAWNAADVGRLRSLLDLLRPSPGEPDLRGWEWRYLWQLAHEDRLTLWGKDDSFADVVFSPDGKTLAGLEGKGRIQLWDRHTGELRRTMGVLTLGHRASLAGGVAALAFSPDGRSLAGPGPAGSLMLYAVDTGLPTLGFEGSPEAVLSLAWSPDGQTLVGALAKHSMRFWNARDGHLIRTLYGAHNGPVAAVAFSPDGHTLASASYDHTVKLWKTEDRLKPPVVLERHTDEVRAVAFSPDGQRIASAGLDRTLRIWDARSGAELSVIWGHTGPVLSLAYGPDSTRIVTGSADETVRVWDATSGQELRAFKGHTDEVVAVAVSPDGRDFASASGDRAVRVWDAASPPRPRTLQSPSVLTYGGRVECVAFSPDPGAPGRLVSGHDDRALRVWELPSGRPLHLLKGHTRRIMCVAFSPDGRTIASCSTDNTARRWDTATGQPRNTFRGHTDELTGLVFTPDGQTVFSGSTDRTIQAWDPATGVVRYVLRGHAEGIDDLALSPDGCTLASCSSDKTCILWDVPSGRPRVTLRGHSKRLNSVAFSPDGRTVATSSDDLTVRLWDAASGSPRGILEGHIDSVDGLAFSPDGRLASSSVDKTIRLWDPASRQTLLILKGHAGRVRRIKFSPDGRTLASAGYDRTLKLWEAAPAAALAAEPDDVAAHSDADRKQRLVAVGCARPAFSPAGRRLVSAGDDQTIRLWDPAGGQDPLTLEGHSGPVRSVAFSGDGRQIASAGDDGTVMVWDASAQLVPSAKHPVRASP